VPRPPTKEALLRALAELEGFEKTLARFPGLTREGLLELLGAAPAGPLQLELGANAQRREPAPASGEGGYARLIINSDGASRGNPGPASIGVILRAPDGAVVERVAMPIGRTTNNIAEYEAVRAGLLRARALGARSILLRADSELAIKQLRGEYRVKNEGLRPIYQAVKELERSFSGGVEYQHVRREQNAEADALANEALDGPSAGS
jgi:ribonuclease HI